jgi:nucleotide-binding universal stress UspA family protein
MTMLDFIVNVGTAEADAPLLRGALMLAHRHQAFLTGLQLVRGDVSPIETSDDPALLESRAQARHDWWLELCREAGVGGDWEVRRGVHVDALAKRSRLADFVIGQLHVNEPDAPAGFDEVTRALFASSSPMLLVPDTWQGGLRAERVAIAWNGSGTAAHAVKAALPLLQQALSVHVLDGERPGLPGISMPPLPLRDWLRRHHVDAQWETFQGEPDAGKNLQERAVALHAELLVVGAWGRSRISELVLGGATRWLLEHATLPLFMAR